MRLRRKRDFLAPSTWASPGRHAEEVTLAVGGVRERLLDRERRPRLVFGPDVDEVERVSRRLDVRKIELGDLADRLENRVQLLAKPLDLLFGQLEPRELRYVQNFVSRDSH